jgi:hypothetical protein
MKIKKLIKKKKINVIKPPGLVSCCQDESLQPGDPLPSVDEITYFVGSIVGVGELAPQSCIMAIAYLSRIRPKLHIHLLNWRRVVLSSLILGCKVWEEHPVFNTDFNELFPEMSGKLLGQLEKHLLNLLRFNVGLTGSEYAKYYFELRDMSPAAFAAHDNPLTDDEIQRLEERSSDAAVSLVVFMLYVCVWYVSHVGDHCSDGNQSLEHRRRRNRPTMAHIRRSEASWW